MFCLILCTLCMLEHSKYLKLVILNEILIHIDTVKYAHPFTSLELMVPFSHRQIEKPEEVPPRFSVLC